jgi:hypothetical protein
MCAVNGPRVLFIGLSATTYTGPAHSCVAQCHQRFYDGPVRAPYAAHPPLTRVSRAMMDCRGRRFHVVYFLQWEPKR